jgi:hypothetical protein
MVHAALFPALFLPVAGGLLGFTSLKEALNSVVKSRFAVVSLLMLKIESRRFVWSDTGQGVADSLLMVLYHSRAYTDGRECWCDLY